MSEELPAENPAELATFHHVRMEYWSYAAQIVSAFAVIISLIFVGIQLRDGNRVAIRNESNATQEQWSAFRASIRAYPLNAHTHKMWGAATGRSIVRLWLGRLHFRLGRAAI